MLVKEKLQSNRELLIKGYESGVSTCELGRRLHCSNASVYVFLRDDCGVEMRKLQKFEDYKDDIKALHDKGMSMLAMSKELGLTRSTTRRYVQKLNLDTTVHSCQREDNLENYAEEIIELYESGIGCTRLSKKFKCAEASILALLKRHNIEIGDGRNYHFNEHFFDKIDTEEKAYVLGFAYGDGHNSEDSLRFNITDSEILEKMKKAIGCDGPIKVKEFDNPKWKTQYVLNLSSREMCRTLTKQGCMPNKSLILKFPTIDQVPVHLVHHFVRGLFDADGTVGVYFGIKVVRYSVSITGSFDVLNGLCKHLSDNNVLDTGGSVCPAYPGSEHTGKWCAGGRIGAQTFLRWLYEDATIYLGRKHKKALPILNS